MTNDDLMPADEELVYKTENARRMASRVRSRLKHDASLHGKCQAIIIAFSTENKLSLSESVAIFLKICVLYFHRDLAGDEIDEVSYILDILQSLEKSD